MQLAAKPRFLTYGKHVHTRGGASTLILPLTIRGAFEMAAISTWDLPAILCRVAIR